MMTDTDQEIMNQGGTVGVFRHSEVTKVLENLLEIEITGGKENLREIIPDHHLDHHPGEDLVDHQGHLIGTELDHAHLIGEDPEALTGEDLSHPDEDLEVLIEEDLELQKEDGLDLQEGDLVLQDDDHDLQIGGGHVHLIEEGQGHQIEGDLGHWTEGRLKGGDPGLQTDEDQELQIGEGHCHQGEGPGRLTSGRDPERQIEGTREVLEDRDRDHLQLGVGPDLLSTEEDPGHLKDDLPGHQGGDHAHLT